MAQQAQQASPSSRPESSPPPEVSNLTLDELTRVMDVARTLRKERSVAERELNRDETIVLLRKKLREAADLAGDPVTDAQIEAAIQHYFDNLHEFQPPDAGFQTTLANLYVRRRVIVGWGITLAAAAMLVWGFWFAGLMPGARRTALRAEQTYSQVKEVSQSIQTISTDAALTKAAQSATIEAATYRDRGDLSALAQLHARLLQQEQLLKEEYRLMIVSAGQSGVDTYVGPGRKLSGYYLIVEAVDSAGNAVPRRVLNAETNQYARVSTWGEEVPKEVYEQVAADKRADGIVDAREFAVKERGKADLRVTLEGTGGVAIERGRQITKW